ncbi:hypothetical protein [Fontivita pretiosa]|uniref:hypothetical protein n=1 Tax=Fontivita pretiosa TaxID=2989684 RepID=UPI003D185CD6
MKNEDIPALIRELRQGLELTQEQFAQKSGAGRFTRDYLQSRVRKCLLDAVENVKVLRNDVAHNEPTPALMADARCRMTQAGLWSSDGRFLTQEIIRVVLMELGESEPESMCDKLLATVRSRLLEHRFYGASSP